MRSRNPEQPADTGQRGGSAATVEALHQQLHAAIEAIESGEQWRSWLDFARRLHQYSFNNIVLIWAQRPDATAVASYTTWRAVNRQVRRGEKALRVMAPIIRRTVATGPDGKPDLAADGRPQRKQRVVGFRPAPVFDITQTDGPPIPTPPQPELLTGSGSASLWAALAAEVIERGYQLKRRPAAELGGANGLTKVEEREVWVRDDVDDAQAVKTLAHELAHVILHTNPAAPPAEGRMAQCAGVREVEAESVAHLVLAAHQIDSAAYSFPYVATWAQPIAAVEHIPIADIVTRTGDRVIKAAAEIINATTPATLHDSDAAGEALAARVHAGAARTADLRDQASAATLPPVDRDVLLGVLADSHDFFRRQIRQSWVPDYLTARCLQDAIGSHELGYAPRSWTALTDHLRSLGYSDDHIAAAGMASRSRSGHLVDRFRDRLTIPLRSLDGHVVGFSGRQGQHHTDGAVGPNYLNSSTTAMFRKSEVLYRLGEHQSDITQGRLPVLCEGPLDAIAVDLLADRTGSNVVGLAVSGTAFTEAHAAQLTAAVSERPICIAFDGDRAGRAAAEAAWRRLTNNGPREVTMVDLPAGTDPSSLFAHDPQSLAQHIESAKPAATVIANWQLDQANLNGNVFREMVAFRNLVGLADRIPTGERPTFVLGLAERLNIDPRDAAVEVAQQNPNLLLERSIEHCRQLDQTLSKTEVASASAMQRSYNGDHRPAPLVIQAIGQ